MTIKIYTLLDKLEYLPEVAQLAFQEWEQQLKKEKINNLEECIQYMNDKFYTNANSNLKEYPNVFLAIHNTTLYGFAFLEEEDMVDRKHYYPWLSSLYVLPEYRNQGIASQLIKTVINCCKINNNNNTTNFQYLYLWCYPQYYEFYHEKGFSVLEKKKYCGKKIVIMVYDLSKKY